MTMKMAKASEADLDMAMELCGAIDGLTGWGACVPEAIQSVKDPLDSEHFDRDDREQCARVLGHLLDLSTKGSLMRVVWGAAVMLDPRNKCVDPQSDVIALHPDAQAGHGAKRARPATDWHEDMGAVLWWSYPINEPPWVGQPTDSDWPGYHTHWTPLIVPEPLPEASAAAPAAAAVV